MRFNPERDVRRFHKKFGESESKGPRLPSISEVDRRILLLREEFEELIEAIYMYDHAKIARECVDVIYTVIGCMVLFGLRLVPCWIAVQRANMAKKCEGRMQKPSKPEGWQSPDEAVNKSVWRRVPRFRRTMFDGMCDAQAKLHEEKREEAA